MVPSDVVTLVTVSPGWDSDGYPADTEYTAEVIAEIVSAKRSEFYAAMQAGKRIDKVFRLWNEDYSLGIKTLDDKEYEPMRVRYKGVEYDITRGYSEDTEKVELNCTRRRENDD